jgi:hypothetical protein
LILGDDVGNLVEREVLVGVVRVDDLPVAGAVEVVSIG